MNGHLLFELNWPELVYWLANHVHHAPERTRANGNRNWPTLIDGFHAAHHAVGRLHCDAAHAPFAEMLLHFEDDVDGCGHLKAHVLRQERVEQLFRGLLVDVVHLCGCESGSFGIYGPSVDRADTNAGPLRRLERAVTLLRGHLFRLRHANFAHTFDREYFLDDQPLRNN